MCRFFVFGLFLILSVSCRSSSGVVKKNYIAREGNGNEGVELIRRSDCFNCHAKEKKLIGPSFISVSEKYEATEKNLRMLSEKILEGGKGHWGEIPMTPHPDLSREDAEAIVRYILLFKQ